MVNDLKNLGRLLKESYLFYNKNSLTILKLVPIAFIPLIIIDRFMLMRVSFGQVSAAFLLEQPIYFRGMEFNVLAFILFVLAAIILSFLILFLFQISLLKTMAAIENKQDVGVLSSYKQAWGLLGKFCIVYFLIMIWFSIWSLLFIIPGIIILGLYSFSAYALVFDGKQGKEALNFSKDIIKKNAVKFLGHVMAMIVITAVIYLSIIFSQEVLFKVHVSCYLSAGATVGELLQDVTTIIMGIYPVIFCYLLYKDMKAQI